MLNANSHPMEGLAARHILHMRSVYQHQLKLPIIQDVPHWLPVDAGRLHRHMRAIDYRPTNATRADVFT
jgi:hypothetical protein